MHNISFPPSEYYHALFDNPKANSILLIDANGIILETNRAFLSSFGYEKEEVTGHHFSMLFTEEDCKKDLPAREINTVLDAGQSFDNNYLVNKNQNQTWASGESVLITSDQGVKYILKIIQNIHQQKESENSIIRLNNFSESILSSIEDAVVVLDEHFEVLKANKAFARIFDLSAQQMSNLDFKAFAASFDIHAGLRNSIDEVIRSRAGFSKIQLELGPAEPEKRIYDVSCSMLDEQNGQLKILLIFHDVTVQKRFEKQQEDILNFVAHEFRNPLTNVILNIQLMEGMLKEKQLKEFDDSVVRIQNNAQRLKKLINELYLTTKLISGNFDPEPVSFDLQDMIDEAIQSARQNNIRYDIIQHEKVAIILHADRDKLSQVLTNYLTNAIKYSNGSTDIRIAAFLQDGTVVVSVKDHGKGIAAKDLPYIFRRFFRAEKTRNLEGLGLGLFLSRQIIDAHNGQTWVESEEGRGSTFYFSIPLPLQ
jgi:PAS domain S-box-containing protein